MLLDSFDYLMSLVSEKIMSIDVVRLFNLLVHLC